MKLRWILLLAAALLLTVLVSPLHTVKADAYVGDYAITCSSFSASGPSDAPFVTLYVSTDGEDTAYYFVIVPVVNGTYSGTLNFPAYPAGTEIFFEVWGTLNLYNDYGDDGYWDEGDFEYDYVNCVPGANGPNIPAGYVLSSIICDTPIYDSPAGSLVGSASVKLGQTFYVNPVAAVAPDGSHWRQIFVGGWVNGYIPSVCVQ